MTLRHNRAERRKPERASRTLRVVPVIVQSAKNGARFGETPNEIRWHRDHIALISLSIFNLVDL